ncbi:putative deoxyhypusine synthase [Candidatus Haloredivivus sp. G17]|nr:putative deoxyhypusine synthase [Candidatus Haloredivivus sp. G17]
MFAYLVREDYVDVVITSSGSHTEDVIKTARPFKMGEWDADEAELRERGINRLGNIYVESDNYVWLESWLNNEIGDQIQTKLDDKIEEVEKDFQDQLRKL